jgi:hypothetical protein
VKKAARSQDEGTAYLGEHQAIIDRALWDKVHGILRHSPRKQAAHSRAQTLALLKGLLFGPDGMVATPTHTRPSPRSRVQRRLSLSSAPGRLAYRGIGGGRPSVSVTV